MNRLTLHRLTTDLDPRFAALLRLYAEAFPSRERKPVAQLHSMLRQSGYSFLLAEHDSRPIGLAILFHAQTAEVSLLEYLAVAPEARGQGFGRNLLHTLRQTPELATRPLLVEVESDRGSIPGQPTPGQPAPGQLERHRRKQFYRSAGAREIAGLRYRMPPVTPEPPPAMELMLFADPVPTALPRTRLAAWLVAIYREVYAKPASDPALREMLGGLPQELRLI